MTGQTFQKKKDVKRLQEAKGPVQELGRKARKRKKKQHAQQQESQDMEDICKKPETHPVAAPASKLFFGGGAKRQEKFVIKEITM